MAYWYERGRNRGGEGIYTPRRSVGANIFDVGRLVRKMKRDRLLRRGGTGRPGYFERRRRMGANAKASRALTLIRKFKKEEERKYAQEMSQVTTIPIGGNWTIQGMGPYTQIGNTVTTRIGNKITVESLAIRFFIQPEALEALGTSVRLIFGIDRRPNGQDPTAGSVMETTNEILSGYERSEEFRGRFQIIYDEYVDFDSTTGVRTGKLFFKKPIKVLYTGTNGNVLDMQKNHFFVMAGSKNNAAAINVRFSFRFIFTDA